MPKILREWSADGLLINYNAAIPEAMIELIKQHELPAVWINSIQSADCVYPDDEKAAYEATQHLLHLGHERIVYATCPVGHYSEPARRQGYEAAMHSAGRAPRTMIVFNGQVDSHDAISLRPENLTGTKAPTAFVCYNTQAVQALMLVAIEAGVAIPRELSLIGFCVSPTEALGVRNVDVMILPEFEMGRFAVEVLMRKVAYPQDITPPKSLPFRFERGWTTAPPLGRT
jgi:LacI family transcriptional regulator